MIKHRHIASFIAAVSTAGVLSLSGPVTAQPTGDQLLNDMGLSDGDRQKVMSGLYVTADVPPVSDRDLSIAIAFVVVGDGAAVREIAMRLDLRVGAQQLDDTAQAFANASAGSSLNLSTSEIAAFKALKGAGTPAVPPKRRRA